MSITEWDATLPRHLSWDPEEVKRKCEALGIDPSLVLHPDSSTESLPNVEPVTHNTFVVRTQAGFRHALRAWGGKVKGDAVHDWPTAYPSLVTFTVGYCGYHYVQCTAIHLNKLMPVLGKHA